MATNSILGSTLRGFAAREAAKIAKRNEERNYNRAVKSWENQDWFTKIFGGGPEGLQKSIGDRARGIYGDMPRVTGTLGDRYAQFSQYADEFRPEIEKSEELGKQLLSGQWGEDVQASYKPVYEARTKAVATNKQAQLQAIAETINRTNAKMRASGFSGGSSTADKVATGARRQVASDIAGQEGAVNVANAVDATNILNQTREARLRAALGGLPQQLAEGRARFEVAPLMQALAAILGPEQEFNSTVAPYKVLNQKPARVFSNIPSDAMLWKEQGAQVADTVADTAMSAASLYAGGGGGMLGGAGGAAGGGAGGGMGGISSMLGSRGSAGGAGGGGVSTGGGGYQSYFQRGNDPNTVDFTTGLNYD